MTTATDNALTFDAIAAKLDAAGLDYARLDRGTDAEAIEVPGYGAIRYRGAWVVDSDEGLPDDELLRDLDELAEYAEAIR